MILDGGFIFKYVSGSHNLYLYVPYILNGDFNYTDTNLVVEMEQINSFFGAIDLSSATPLTAFNLLNQNQFNIFYTSTVGTDTLLVSYLTFDIASITP